MGKNKKKSGSNPWGGGPMGDFLNAYCQLKGTRPIFEFGEATVGWSGSGGWKCTVRIPGAGEAMGTAGNKKEAQDAAMRAFVIKLQAAGVMIKFGGGGGQQQATAVPTGPSWAVQGAKAPVLPVGNLQRPLAQGLVPVESGPQYNITAPMSKMSDLLRRGQADDALEVAEEQLDGKSRCIQVKQLAQMMLAVGVRSKEEAVLGFFDGLAAMELVAFPNPPAAAYFWRFGRWAVREFLAEGRACAETAQKTIPQNLERQGTCIQMLRVDRSDKGSMDVALAPPSGDFPRFHGFQTHDWVFITHPANGQVRSEAGHNGASVTFEGELTSFQWTPCNSVVVKVVGADPQSVQKMIGGTARIDRAANHVTFQRQVQALLTVCTKPDELDWLSLVLMAAEEECGLERVAGFCNVFPPNGGFQRASPILNGSNPSQFEALQAATTRRITLIQGPPGAGKTATAVMLMRLWVSSARRPLLATADSNIAADNLVAGCASAGLNVVRVGRREGYRPELKPYMLYEKAREAGCLSGPRHHWRGERKILEQADVVCCTCSGAEHPAMHEVKFKNVIIDEAGQTTELATLVPMMHLEADGSVVLVGDHRQLPATVACLEADVEGLGTSLFQRLESIGVPPMMLDIQYRMHPALAAFPSHQYYGGRLRSGVAGTSRLPPKGVNWPDPCAPIAFLPVQSAETKEGKSFTNLVEARTIKDLMDCVLASNDVRPGQIGIVTPYKAQARLLRDLLGLSQPGERRAEGVQMAPEAEVSSVDGFQGREKDLILISTVRANPQGNIGFTGDPRRLNVMFTRAKRGLVVIGDFNTLSKDERGWRPWLAWVQERGLIVGCPATQPVSADALRKLHRMPPHELLAMQPSQQACTGIAPAVPAGSEAGVAAQAQAPADAAAREAGAAAPAAATDSGAAAQAEVPVGPRPRKKSRLMQIREEAERAAKEKDGAGGGSAE